jgi:hypothetical protein
MQRFEAIAFLKELDALHLIQPSMVLIKQRKPDSCELRIKGFYDLKLIRDFTQKYNLTVEEDLSKGYLSIF